METKQMFDEVIEKLRKVVMESDVTSEEYKIASRQLMEMSKQRIELEKIEKTKLDQADREAMNKKGRKVEIILKVAEITVPLLMLGLRHAQTVSYAKMICNFEENGTFTTSAGKGLTGILRIGK